MTWKKHYCRVGKYTFESDDDVDPAVHAERIETWLTSVVQSEHLALLIGSGFSTAISLAAGKPSAGMGLMTFDCSKSPEPPDWAARVKSINDWAQASAVRAKRGTANIEDQVRSALQLIGGLEVLNDPLAALLRESLQQGLKRFLEAVLQMERDIADAAISWAPPAVDAQGLLVTFLLSFASRTATRERLNIFTTNYDRVIEFGCDSAGLHILDRFVGELRPVFRSSRLGLDLHYNPPGIRGEPRYLEGVVRLTKIHGSLDWRWEDDVVTRAGIRFGASPGHPELSGSDSIIIYPNPAKDVETLDFPYAELFRDLAAALCRPNSALVVFGYGFGDDHINRVIRDMLTIPSSHLVIIAYGDREGRIKHFCDSVGRTAQMSILYGPHLGNLHDLVAHYLPKPAIDYLTARQVELLAKRGSFGAAAPVPTTPAASAAPVATP